MATTFLAATPIQDTFFIPGGAVPGNGVQLFCYAAGSTTKTTVYKDGAGATPHTNPIVLDSGGNIPSGGEVWQTQGQSMKYVYAPSNDTDPPASPYRTLDNMPGMNDVSAQTGVEWLTGPTPTFVSATSFTLVGDQTATFTKGRRVKTTNTGGTVYSTIVTSAFGALTTVTVVNDSGSIDSGLSAVSYGLFDPANVSVGPAEIYRKGANVSSATGGTTNIWGIVGDYVHVTGTTGIQHFSSAPYAGSERTVIFDGALTVFSSAAIAIPGNVNLSTAANASLQVRADTVSSFVVTGVQGMAQGSSQVFVGPSSGANAPATFRGMVGAESGLTLLSVKSVTNSSQVNFNTGDFSWTAYDEYWFDFVQVVPTSSNVNVQSRVSVDGGVTYVSSAAAYASIQSEIGLATTNVMTLQNTTLWNLNNTGLDNVGTNYGMNGRVEVNRPSSVINKEIIWRFVFPAPASSLTKLEGVGQLSATNSAWTGIQFFPGSGNFSSGSFYAYGLRKA
jgi:hypothetical protein